MSSVECVSCRYEELGMEDEKVKYRFNWDYIVGPSYTFKIVAESASENTSVEINLTIYVKEEKGPIFSSVLEDKISQCTGNEICSINLHECKVYLDISYFEQDFTDLTFYIANDQDNKEPIENGIIEINPLNQQVNQLVIEGCGNLNTCTSITYSMPTLSTPLNISLESKIYNIPQGSHLQITVRYIQITDEFGNTLNKDQVKQLWISGNKPVNMYVDLELMKIIWNVPRDYTTGRLELKIYAEGYDSLGISQDELIIDVKTGDELELDVLIPRIEDRICWLIAEKIDCEMDVVKGNLYLVFGQNVKNYEIEYEISDSVLKTEFSIIDRVLVWERSHYSADKLLDESPEILLTFKIKEGDAHLTIISEPFTIIPIWEPIISDLSPISPQSTCSIAYIGLYYTCSFTITRGPLIYPENKDHFIEQDITVSISESQTIQRNANLLTFNPVSSSSISITITISYTLKQQISRKFSQSYDIDIFQTSTYSPCIELNTDKVIYILRPNSIHLNDCNIYTDCAQSDSSNLLSYSLAGDYPSTMVIENDILKWTPDISELGVYRDIAIYVGIEDKGKIDELVLSMRPKSYLEVELSDLSPVYGGRFVSCLRLVDEDSSISIQDLEVTLDEKDDDIELMENVCIVWNPVDMNGVDVNTFTRSIQLTIKDSPNLEGWFSQTITPTFTLNLQINHLIPTFTNFPLSDTDKYAKEGELWSKEVKCSIGTEGISFIYSISSQPSMILNDRNIIEFTPEYQSCSNMTSISCTSSNSDIPFSTYSFVLNDIETLARIPNLELEELIVTEQSDIEEYQLPLKELYSEVKDVSITIESSQLALYEGLIMYKLGYLVWNSQIFKSKTTITDNLLIHLNIKDKSYLFNLPFELNPYDEPPIVSPLSPIILDRMLLTTSKTFQVNASNEENTNLEYISQTSNLANSDSSSNQFTWSPSPSDTYTHLSIVVSDGVNEVEVQTMGCQGLECRKYPILDRIETLGNCLQIEDDNIDSLHGLIDCKVRYYNDEIRVDVYGKNFKIITDSSGKHTFNYEVFIGRKKCHSIDIINSEHISCILPIPISTVETYQVYLKHISSSLASYPNLHISYSSYSSPELIPGDLFKSSDNFLITPDDNYEYKVVLYGTGFFEDCTCLFGEYEGYFEYMSDELAYCYIEDFMLDIGEQYNMKIKCGERESSSEEYIITARDVEDVTLSSIKSGHSHGGYKIPLLINNDISQENCENSKLMIHLDDYYFDIRHTCKEGNNLNLYIRSPQFPNSTTTRYIYFSLNRGLTWSTSDSLSFNYSVFCSIGYYTDSNICSQCPKGSYCNKSNSNLDYLQSPRPCDLGSYQNSSGSTSCKLCSEGYQCFCKGMENSVICDAGYICDQEGIVKRWKPCPSGHYCPKGTQTKFTQSVVEVRWYGYCQGYDMYGMCNGVMDYCQNPKIWGWCGYRMIRVCYTVCYWIFYWIPSCVGWFWWNWWMWLTCFRIETVCFQECYDWPSYYQDFCEAPVMVGYCNWNDPSWYKYIYSIYSWPWYYGWCQNAYDAPSYSARLLRKFGNCRRFDTVQLANNMPIECPEGVYCVGGIYQLAPIEGDSYTPGQCPEDLTCNPGSGNPNSPPNCSVGSFCPFRIPKAVCKEDDDFIQFSQGCTCKSTKCPCSRGYFCNSDKLMIPVKCPSGTYSNQLAGLDCLPCEAGKYCPYDTSNAPREMLTCPKGNKCEARAINPTVCDEGYYQENEGQSSCEECREGYYCPYKEMNEPIKCPAGRVCSTKGLIVPTNCPEGYFCSSGTNSTIGYTEEEFLKPDYSKVTALSSGRPVPCEPGEACPMNSSSAQVCVLGSYTLTWLSTFCLSCPKGKLCPSNNQEPLECPGGSWCSDNQEFGCPEKYYCLPSTTTPYYLPHSSDTNYELRPIPCRPGTYCIGRNTHWDSNDKTTRNPAKACSPGTYNDQYAQVECKECPAGYRCSVSACITPIQCQPGTWSSKKSVSCQLCPQGTYNPNTGSTSMRACIKCPAGLVCESEGIGSYIGNSSKCPAGFYCPEGTNVANKQDYPCPIGTFCYEGTKNLNEALRNKCPAGRFCDSGTGAENEEAYKQCLLDPKKCDIGANCKINSYCESGTKSPAACPEGTVSYGGASSMSDCIRDHTRFYDFNITHTEEILDISVLPLTFNSFELEFVNMYEKATIPEDLQMVIEISEVKESRYLASENTRILLFSNTYYGTQYSVPMIYPQIRILNKKLNVKFNLFTNISIRISLGIEYLKGKVNWDNEIIDRSKVQLTTSSVFSSSFLCVISRDIGELFEDPINIYRIYSLDSNSKLKSSEMSIMNDIFLSIEVESDSSASNSFYPEELWDALPSSVDEYYTTYLPYITDCIPGYGAFLPLSALMSDSRCDKVTNPTPVTISGFFDEVQATSCNYQLTCDFSLDLDVIDRRKRWYETITDSNNSGISYKDKLPPFYISRRSIESSDIYSYTSQSKVYQDTLIPVRVTRDSDSSWQTGYVPDKVELQLGYYQKTPDEFEIITANLVLSNFRDKDDRTNQLYTFGVNIRPLNWTECFDNNAFTKEEYANSTFIIASGLASLIGIIVIIALIFRPYKYKPVFAWCVVNQFVRSFQGLIMVLLPTLIAGYMMWMLLNEGKMFSYDTGNFDDKSVVTDLNSDDAMRYRAGRFGTCLCVIGLLIINWSVNLLIPMKVKESYDYKQVNNTHKEEMDNNRNSGALIAIIVISILYNLILSSFGDYDLFTRMPYIFILITAFGNYFLTLVCVRALKSEMQAIVVELTLSFGVFCMILGCKRLTLILFCFWVLYSIRILSESYFQSLLHKFLNKIFLKKNERFLTLHSQLSTRQEICYTNLKEMGKKSQGYILTWLISFYSLFLWYFYPYLNLSMPRDNYLYITYLTGYLVFLEIFIQFGAFWVRQARDKNFRIHFILKSANKEYYDRSVTWAISSNKVRYELNLSSQVVDLYACAFSSQYYFVMFLACAGILSLFCGVKMFLHCKYSPFMDYNLFFLVIITGCITIVVKNLSVNIAKRAIWKPRNTVKVNDRTAFGQFIMNMNKVMIGKLGKKEMENKPDFNNINFVEVAKDITLSLENVKNTEDQLNHIVSVLKQRQISKMVSYDKIFQTITTSKGRVDGQGLQDKIEKTQIPEIKILYIEALRTKNREKWGHFPKELVYPW